jgi:ESF2/ABP1 family protein
MSSEETSQKAPAEIDEELIEIGAKQRRKGVCYMSKVPPYMNPDSLRRLLAKKFEIGRIFLQPEAENITRTRKKMGGNNKLKYVEGWIEFDKKKEAKMAAMVLNNQLMGGKKRHNMFHDDTW